MVSILPEYITHYPFHKINPKHFNFDTAEVWPKLHCVPIFCQSNIQMYRVYFTSILITICYTKSCTYYPRTNSLNIFIAVQ